LKVLRDQLSRDGQIMGGGSSRGHAHYR